MAKGKIVRRGPLKSQPKVDKKGFHKPLDPKGKIKKTK
jgi:hypothetical protein